MNSWNDWDADAPDRLPLAAFAPTPAHDVPAPLAWALPHRGIPMITVTIDVEAEYASIRTPEEETTITFSGRVSDKPVYQITAPNGRISTALNFREAVEFCVGRAIRSATLIAKIRRAS